MSAPAFLEGGVVTLRPVEEADLEFFHANINDPAVWHSLARRRPVTQGEEREWIESAPDDEVHFAVYADGAPVGGVGLHRIDEAGDCELGFWITPDEQGEGYGSAAAEVAVGYAFDHLRRHRVSARAFASNRASRALLESVGFREEGVRSDAAFVDGQYVDVVAYGLLVGAWDG